MMSSCVTFILILLFLDKGKVVIDDRQGSKPVV
jgi:hypothetical protein